MMYLGDYAEDQPVYFAWNTSDSDGASITRSGDGTISVYKDASNGTAFDTTQVTTGITNDEDFDGLTGVHTCSITTTDAWYETGHDYMVVLSGSTIDTQTVNVVLAHFSIENRFMRGTDSAATAAALTTHDGKLDTVDTNVDSILTDTGTTLPARFTGIEGATFDTGTDSLEAVRNRGDAEWVTATGFSTHTAGDIWSVATRILTASTNFNDISAADVNTQVDTALSDINLDHLMKIGVDTNWATTVHLDSALGHIADVGTTATFDRTSDALEAIRNRGDSEWITATGFNTVVPDAAGVAPTAVEIRQEMDANSTRLDADISSRSTVTTAQVNAEVVDVLRTDTSVEPTQGAPTATPTMEEMIKYLYFKLRNKGETTSTEDTMYADNGSTKIMKATISDNGTTFTKSEYVSG